MRPHVHYMFTSDERPYGRCSMADKLTFTAEGRDLYMEDEEPKRVGRIVRNPALARTLEQLGAEGPDLFYHGALAQLIAEDAGQAGGLLSLEDLATFKVRREGHTHRKGCAQRPKFDGRIVITLNAGSSMPEYYVGEYAQRTMGRCLDYGVLEVTDYDGRIQSHRFVPIRELEHLYGKQADQLLRMSARRAA